MTRNEEYVADFIPKVLFIALSSLQNNKTI